LHPQGAFQLGDDLRRLGNRLIGIPCQGVDFAFQRG
jgi:hypothetical protein